MTYVVKRIDEQMYGCEEPAPDINEGDTAVLTADGLLKKV